jgi:hypothetical protein
MSSSGVVRRKLGRRRWFNERDGDVCVFTRRQLDEEEE